MASSITPDPAIQLFYAVCNGDADNVKSLLARQPPPAINAKHSRDSRGFHVNSATALHIACERRNIEIVRILLEKGASPHTLDGKRRTPLHLAAGARSIEIIRSLLSWVQDREGYVDLRDEQGNTPLLVACAQPQRAGEDRNMDVLSHLLAEGADLRAINNDGETAAHRATRDSGDLEILKYLGDNARELLGLQTIFMGRNSNTCLHLATWLGRVQHVEWLLEAMRYADIRKEDADGRTAWDIACGLRAHGTDLSSFQVSSTFAEKEGGVMDPSLQWHRIAEVGSLKTYALWTHNYPAILALLKHLVSKQDIDERVADRIYHDVRDDRYLDSGPRFREPRCDFDSLNTPGDFSIVMPFLGFDRILAVRSWRESFVDVEDAWTSLQKTRQYCYSANPNTERVYPALTLDEFCCQSLSKAALERRNHDQVALSLQAKDAEAMPPKSLLVVKQAWMWKLGDICILSGASTTEGTGLGKAFRPDYGHRGCIGLLMAHMILSTEGFSQKGNIFTIYERALTNVSNQVDEYLRDISTEGVQIETEKDCLHRIIDVQEELSMIKRVILQQEEVWKEFASASWPEFWTDDHDGKLAINPQQWKVIPEKDREFWISVLRVEPVFKKYLKRVAQLDEDAQRVERSITAMLDLKTKHAAMREAHTSAIMSAAVLGFTIVTIIFTPLSFLTSLLALPMADFQTSQSQSSFTSESGVYSSSYVLRKALATEFATLGGTLFLMWLAIKLLLHESIIRPFIRLLLNLLKLVYEWSRRAGRYIGDVVKVPGAQKKQNAHDAEKGQ